MSHIVSDSNIIVTASTKVSADYFFDASAKLIRVNDSGFVRIVGIVNLGTNDVIYNIGDPSLSGTISGNGITLDFDTTSMSDDDVLHILYEHKATPGSIEALLQKQIDNQKQIIKLLQKIYNPI